MTTRMLIDATHEEETRVVVVKGNRVEEFDFETAARKPLKGNIYLARVTRVEPSLQAAFVDFGGNRHGFLAFSEIHPDYYQIPVADRERLKQEEAEAAAAYDDDDEEEEEETVSRHRVEDGDPSATDLDGDHGEAEYDEAAEALQPEGADPAVDAAPAAAGDMDDGEAAGHHDSGGDEDAGGNDEPQPPSGHGGTRTLPDRTGLRRVARLFGLSSADSSDSTGPSTAATADRTGDQPADRSDNSVAAVEHGGFEMEVRQDLSAGGEEVLAGPAVSDPDDLSAAPAGESEAGGAEFEDDGRSGEERDDSVESFGGDTVDEVRRRRSKRRPLTRRYKIQEVIKRRQILLVQVVKEERGNKGAALTTYMSLAGRYCVLMPNSPNGGGISRKIVSANDRKRLKSITSELDVPEGMGMIVRTAGMERTRAEIKRDFEFLLRTWDHIRELTLASMAPCLVYEEANLIKRSIRDLYAKEIDEVLVEGENGYRTAKDLMKMLMPSHSKRVQPYRDRIPLFHRYQIENQLDEMYNPTVQLKSGGYLVINSTEALVAIDVNSGRSTKEHNIEGTAYKTNMEAAEEVARQLRLRDLAGLIVIDFIDMDEGRNNRNVERKLKECLKLDRARIQVGRISSFGLLEMSRQRLRPSLIEQSMVTCPHCDGQGHVRSIDSAAIRAIRAAEDEGIRERSAEATLVVPTPVAIYLLNSKRDVLGEIEGRYGIRILVRNDDTLGPSDFTLERSKTRSDGEPAVPKVITAESVPYRSSDEDLDETDPEVEAEADAAIEAEARASAEALDEDQPARRPSARSEDDEDGTEGQKDEGGARRKRRRRRRRVDEVGGDGEDAADDAQDLPATAKQQQDAATGQDDPRTESRTAAAQPGDSGDDPDEEDDGEDGEDDQLEGAADGDDEQSQARRSRRRGRRGGRRRRRRQDRDGEGVEASDASGDDGDAAARPEIAASDTLDIVTARGSDEDALSSEHEEPEVEEASVDELLAEHSWSDEDLVPSAQPAVAGGIEPGQPEETPDPEEARAEEARAEEARAREARAREARAQEARAQEARAQEARAQEALAQEAADREAAAREAAAQEAAAQEAADQEAADQEAAASRAADQEPVDRKPAAETSAPNTTAPRRGWWRRPAATDDPSGNPGTPEQS